MAQSNPRTNTVLVSLVAAIVVPRIEQVTGVKLTTDDVAALMALAAIAWHSGAALLEAFPAYVQKFHPTSPTGENPK